MKSSDLEARNKLLKARVLATRGQVASCSGTGPPVSLPMACLPVSTDFLLALNDPLHDLLVLLCVLCGTGYLSTGTLPGFSLLGVSFGGCTTFTTGRPKHMRSLWSFLLLPKPLS